MAGERDVRIARIVEAMDLQSSVLILNSDHGHTDTGGHGGWEEEVVVAPLVIVGEGIKPGSYGEVEQADIAPTVAALLGISMPTHNQGQPLFDMLEMPAQARAQRALDAARQHQAFYNQYLSQMGAGSYAGNELAEADEALAQGDYQRAYERGTEFSEGIRRYAEGAKQDKIWRERLGRLPITLLILVLPALYLAFYTKKRELVIPLIGAGLYFLLYNGYFFIRGFNWSLSVWNEEWMLPIFMKERLVEAGISLLIAVIVVGVLMRGKTILETAQVAVNTSFLVGFGLLLQVDLYYWLFGLDMDWYLPSLQWGFKYYLDLQQLLPTGLMGLFAPLIAMAVKVVTDRISLARPRPARVSEER